MKKWRTLSFFVYVILLSCNGKESSPIDIDISSELVYPKNYIITKVAKAPTIDGLADESQWEQAHFSTSFTDIEGQKIPKFNTKMKMLWDDNYLYIFTEMEEPHVWGDISQRDAIIYLNNDFEVFISPSGATHNYGEIEINALGTVWDLLLSKPYRDGGKANFHWDLPALKSAVAISGSLNNPSDIDSGWSVEMAIPMKALLELKKGKNLLPIEGEQWRINFSRVEWDFDLNDGKYSRMKLDSLKFEQEYNWVWSNQGVINMHEPEKWGYLQFTKGSTSEGIAFRKDESYLFSQVMYSLYRNCKHGSLKSLLNEEIGMSTMLNVFFQESSHLKAYFLKTNMGFEIIINSDVTKISYLINESGRLKIIE